MSLHNSKLEPYNLLYMRTKKEKMNHNLNLV
jgi:GTP cyclohydrolase II